MRISSREKWLLVMLLSIALIAGWYYFLLTPTEAKIAELEVEKSLKTAEKSEIELKLASEPSLDKRIETLEATMTKASEKFYGDLSQEEMLMIIKKIRADVPIEFSTYAFSEGTLEGEQGIKFAANLQYTGEFEALQDLLKNVRTNDKKVIVREISAKNDLTENLSGNINLEFNGIPQVEMYAKPYPKLVTSAFIGKDSTTSPFKAFEGFDIAVAVEEEQAIINYPNYPEYPDQEAPPIDYAVYRPKTQIYGFEDGSNFFVGNSPDIVGYVARSKAKVAGGYSTEMVFDFVTGRMHSEANLVFDTNPVMINKQAEYLGLWVFAYEASDHAIGAVIIDSKGKEYRVELTPEVGWTRWKEIEVLLPVEITYPAMVQRIYVEGVGYDQKLTGKYLFDQLQVSYPVY
ncbi:MAG: hypothetical protein IBX70_12445 [Clostridia bacterium]|nr:hypothetical protein [Clostridia bacterium]